MSLKFYTSVSDNHMETEVLTWFFPPTNFQHAGEEIGVENVKEDGGSQAEVGGVFRGCAQIQQLLCGPPHHLNKI